VKQKADFDYLIPDSLFIESFVVNEFE
jgi:hypothetical protein